MSNLSSGCPGHKPQGLYIYMDAIKQKQGSKGILAEHRRDTVTPREPSESFALWYPDSRVGRLSNKHRLDTWHDHTLNMCRPSTWCVLAPLPRTLQKDICLTATRCPCCPHITNEEAKTQRSSLSCRTNALNPDLSPGPPHAMATWLEGTVPSQLSAPVTANLPELHLDGSIAAQLVAKQAGQLSVLPRQRECWICMDH